MRVFSLWHGVLTQAPGEPCGYTMAGLTYSIAQEHGLRVSDLQKRYPRQRDLVHVRQEAMWSCRMYAGKSNQQIAQYFGLKDPSTVQHGIQAHARRIAA